MAHKRRQDQLGEQIAEDLSDLIRTRMKDPRIGFASITHVELSADLRHAKVFVSVMGSSDDQRATLHALGHASGFLRHELAQRLSIRFTPEIVFQQDESIARGARVLELMRQVQGEVGPAPTPPAAPPLAGARGSGQPEV